MRDQNLNKHLPDHLESAQSVLLALTSPSDAVLPEAMEMHLERFEAPNNKLFHILRYFLRPFFYSAMGSIGPHSPPAQVQLPSLVKF